MGVVSNALAEGIARCFWWIAIFSLLTPFELLLPMGMRQPLVRRLQGLVFWVVSVATTTAWLTLYGHLRAAIGIKPIATIDLLHLNAWSGVGAGTISVVCSAMLGDLAFYWFHRAQHAVPWLWRFHSVHHAIRDVSAVNSYHHVTETMLQSALVALPLSFLPITAAHIPVLSGVFALQVVAIHCPTRLHLGPLRGVLVDNRFHRIHHSLEERHFDKNFAANFSFWDVLFGTAYFPATDEWPDTGLAEVPEPASIKDWLLPPSKDAGRRIATGAHPSFQPEPSE